MKMSVCPYAERTPPTVTPSIDFAAVLAARTQLDSVQPGGRAAQYGFTTSDRDTLRRPGNALILDEPFDCELCPHNFLNSDGTEERR
jgi:hypothetical protein